MAYRPFTVISPQGKPSIEITAFRDNYFQRLKLLQFSLVSPEHDQTLHRRISRKAEITKTGKRVASRDGNVSRVGKSSKDSNSRPKTSRGKPHPSPDEFFDYVVPSPDSKSCVFP